MPEEFFLEENVDFKKEAWGVASFDEYLEAVLQEGTTPNGVFGVKMGPGVIFRYLEYQVRTIPRWNDPEIPIYEIFSEIFPNLKFIWLTRRNKVRQAVSWWKAVQTGEWWRLKGEMPKSKGNPEYVFESIDHLFNESTMRDASWQNHFDNWNVQPLTLVFEDLVNDFKGTIEEVLSYLGIDDAYEFNSSKIGMMKQSDGLSEEWVHRYKEEKQREWPNVAW